MWGFIDHRYERILIRGFIRFGSDLLSHALRRSTIGAAALNCRVRDGIGCFARAIATKPKEQHPGPPVLQAELAIPVVVKDDLSKSRTLTVYAFEPVYYWIKSSLSDN